MKSETENLQISGINPLHFLCICQCDARVQPEELIAIIQYSAGLAEDGVPSLTDDVKDSPLLIMTYD